MSASSKIEWTETTWNPVTGCTKISAGCKNCYAERLAKRLCLMGSERYKNNFDLTLHEDTLGYPKKWRKPRVIFVNSMSDLFHKDIPTSYIQKVFKTMNECPQHTFQVLTKRSGRLKSIHNKLSWSPNIWMGVSVENMKVANRIEDLKVTSALTKFISFEPLLEEIKGVDLNGIDWAIIGGESGPKARPMEQLWANSLLDQCKASEVAFFFKQWGGVQKHRTGRTLNGRTYDEMPKTTQLMQVRSA